MVGVLTGYLRAQRLAKVMPYIHGAMLDLGCGDVPVLSRLPGDVAYIGVDARPDMVDWLHQHYPNRTFLCCDLDQEMLNVPGPFDTILMMAVIEHLERPDFILRQIPALLKPSGRVVITTPSPFGNKLHHIGSSVGLFSRDAAEEHKFLFNRNGLENLLSSCGLQVTDFSTFLFGQNQLCVAMRKQG